MTETQPADGDLTTAIRIEGIATDPKALPWWRRPRRLQRQLVSTLVLVALITVLLVAGLNFFAARQLLDEGSQEQLASIGAARARSIELGVDQLLGRISAAAADPSVVEAAAELTVAYNATNDRLDPTERAELEDFYEQRVAEPLSEVDEEPVAVGDLLPTTETGRYLQYNYTVVEDPEDAEARRTVADAGDGSRYSDVHADKHPFLAELASTIGAGDLHLVADGGTIVYTTEKRIDFATDLTGGPYSETKLATTVGDSLGRVRTGEAVLVDQELYLPADGRPVVFVAATLRRDTEVLGALVAEIPIDGLNALTTANGEWEAVGLGAGESYVVGADRLLRSESRLWLEDPDEFLEKVDDPETERLISLLGSPVGLQLVDTEPVDEALNGLVFEGTATDYLGRETFTYATPVEITGTDWVMVASVPLDDAREPLLDYARREGLVLLIVLPLAALLGYFMAGRLTRGIPTVMAAANSVAAGDRDPDLPNMGRDELGDLARRLKRMAGDLGQQEAALAAEYERNRNLLLTVLPPRIVEADGAVGGTGEAADVATAVAVTLGVSAAPNADDTDLAELRGRLLEVAEQLAEEQSIERIQSGADGYLFLSGIGNADDGADEAIALAADLTSRLRETAADEDVELDVHIGLSTGPVATGVLDKGSLTFGAWGEPVRRALAIGSLSRVDEILVDDTTAAAVTDDRWTLRPAEDVVDLDNQPMDLFSLTLR